MTREDYNEILQNDEIKTNTPKTEPVAQNKTKNVENKNKRHFFKPKKIQKTKQRPKENNINKIIIIVTIAILIIILIFVLLGALQKRPNIPNGEPMPPSAQHQQPVLR